MDDGSTDESGIICDCYAAQDRRIAVIHKENGGVSDARNYGLDRASGEYICFVDSDDYVGPDYLKAMIELINDHHADLAIVSNTIVFGDIQAITSAPEQLKFHMRLSKMNIGSPRGDYRKARRRAEL